LIASAPVHVLTNFVRGTCNGTHFNKLCLDQSDITCNGTHFNKLCLDQSDITLKAGRAQEVTVVRTRKPHRGWQLRPEKVFARPGQAPGSLLRQPKPKTQSVQEGQVRAMCKSLGGV